MLLPHWKLLLGSVVVHIQASEATYRKDLMKTEGAYSI